jgi:hypothetical protein
MFSKCYAVTDRFHVQNQPSFTRNQNQIPLAIIDQENEAMEKAKKEIKV